jgi:hypothetical protein
MQHTRRTFLLGLGALTAGLVLPHRKIWQVSSKAPVSSRVGLDIETVYLRGLPPGHVFIVAGRVDYKSGLRGRQESGGMIDTAAFFPGTRAVSMPDNFRFLYLNESGSVCPRRSFG